MRGVRAQVPAPAPAAAPATKSFKPEELDQMLAPIALYPDPLLSQILMAAGYPLEIVEAARWRRPTRRSRATPPSRPSRTRSGTPA